MEATTLTQQLIEFRSPSHVSNVDISQFLVDRLRQSQFEMETVSYRDHHGIEKVNVLARIGPHDPATPGLAYFCHSDVVPADHWTGPGEAFSATQHDGKLFGRGSCDMKGSAACMLTAIDQVDLNHLDAPLYFICTADEELSYTGAQHVVAKSQLYREMVDQQPRVLVGEPTDLTVVHAHKGICKLTITSHGQAAHSSTRDGLNANLAMIPFLQTVRDIYDETESRDDLQNDVFDPPTMSWNIGINDHTHAINVKPARCVCTIFYRPLPDVDDSVLIARVRTAATQHGLDFSEPARCDAVYTDPQDSFVRDALSITGQHQAMTVSYGTDAGVMPELQRKIVCGPGSIAQAHTEDEWISLEQLSLGTELYHRFLSEWCVT